MRTSTMLRFGTREDVVRDMKKLRRELPRTGITTPQHLVSEHLLTPLTHAEKDKNQAPKAAALGALYEVIATSAFVGETLKNRLLPPDPITREQQRKASTNASRLASKITDDPEMAEGLDDFTKAHGPLTRNETLFLNAHRDRKGQVTRLPLLAKVVKALTSIK
jgi:hypothetical protein